MRPLGVLRVTKWVTVLVLGVTGAAAVTFLKNGWYYWFAGAVSIWATELIDYAILQAEIERRSA